MARLWMEPLNPFIKEIEFVPNSLLRTEYFSWVLYYIQCLTSFDKQKQLFEFPIKLFLS